MKHLSSARAAGARALVAGVRGLALVLGLWGCGISEEDVATPARRTAGLRIEQRSNGLPGEAENDREQQILVTPTRLRLLDKTGLQSSILYLLDVERDPPAIWRVSEDRREYRSCTDLEAIQMDRDNMERQLLVLWREEGLSGAELDKNLKQHFLRADGRREVTLETSDVPERRLGHAVKRHVVRENGRVIVDALVTTEIDAGVIPFFDFYRHVGAFSKEVLAKLREIPGVPVAAQITVVTATLNYEIAAEVVKLEVVPALDPAELELPPGAQEVKESPTAPCPSCGKPVQKEIPGRRASKDGKALYFCDDACFQAFRDAGGLGPPKKRGGAAERRGPPGE